MDQKQLINDVTLYVEKQIFAYSTIGIIQIFNEDIFYKKISEYGCNEETLRTLDTIGIIKIL